MTERSNSVAVWDPWVRVGHWLLVAAFAVAYLTGGPPPVIHVWAGYVIGAIVVLRVIWGVVGPRHARFRNFVRGPGPVLRYLRDLLRLRASRHLGHSPAGGAMVVALLLSLALTVGAGLLAYGAEKHAGPLALLFPAPVETAAPEPLFPSLDDEAASGDGGDGAVGGDRRRDDSPFVEIHELFANLTLLLIALHVGGVVLASVAHRENLIGAMVTGRKRAP